MTGDVKRHLTSEITGRIASDQWLSVSYMVKVHYNLTLTSSIIVTLGCEP